MSEHQIRKPVTVAEWDAMAPEEQDALIASGWHPGPGAYSDRALQVRYARRDRDFWKARAETAKAEAQRYREGLREIEPVLDELIAWINTDMIGCLEVEQRGEQARLKARALLAASPDGSSAREPHEGDYRPDGGGTK